MSRDGLDAAGSDPRAPSAPPRQTRRCRRRLRTTTTERARTPSIGSCPCLAARAGSTSLVVHARCLTPHPVTRDDRASDWNRSPIRRRHCLVKGWAGRLELPRARRRRLVRGACSSRRERCVSPTSATDVTPEHYRIARFPAHRRAASALRRARHACQLTLGPPVKATPRGRFGCLPNPLER